MYQIDQNADRQREQSQQNQEVIVDQVKTPNQKSQFYHLNENEEEKNHSSHVTSQRNSLQRDSLNIDKLQGHSPQISLQGHQVSSGAQQNTSQQLPSSKLKTNSFFSSQLQGSNGTPIFSIDSSKNVQSNYLAFKGQSIMNQNEKNNSNCSISYPIKKQSQYSMQTENVSSHQIHNNNNLTLSSNYYMMNKKSIQSERRQSNSKNNQFQNLSGHQQSNNQQIQPLKAKNTNNINSQMQRYYQRSNSEYYAKTQNVLSKKKNNEFNSFQLSSKAQSQIVRGHKVKKVKNLIKQELFDRLTSNFAMCSNSKYNIDLQKIEEMKENLEGQQRFMNMVVHDMRNPAEAVNTGLKQAREISKIQTAQIIKDTQQIIKKNHSQIARKIKGEEQKNNIPITLNKYKVGSGELQKQENLQRNNSQQINNNQKSKYNQIIKNNKKNSFPVQSLSQQNNNENSEISYSKQQISDIQMSLKSINSQKSQNFNSDNKQKYQESINKSKELQQQSIFSQQNNRMGQQNNLQININNESSIANIQQRQQIQQSSFNRQLIFNRQFEEEEKVPENNNQNNYYQPFFQGQSDQYEFVPYSAVFGQNQHIVPQINPNQHTDQKNIKNSSNKNNQQEQIKAEAFNQSIEPIENTEQNDLMKILQLIQNEQQKEEIIPYNSIGLQLQIEEDDQIVQRDQINEDSEYDFESDDIDEESGLNANQIKLENNIPQSSLIINQPRQININDGANFKREAAVNKNVNYIEKIIPVFQQENVLKIERQVQTDNQQSNRESELVHQLIQNKDFLDFSQNYYEYIQILKVQRELNGQNLKSNDAMQILKEQVLQSNNNQIVDQIQQNNSPIFMIGQSQNQQLLLQNDDLRISKFNDDNQLLIPQNNMNMSHNQILSDSDRIIPRKSQMKQNTDQQSYISHQHNKSLYSDNDQKAKDCFTCESYMKSLSLILEQFQKLLKVNQTLDYYSQNSISSSQIILNLIEDLLSLAKINKNVFEINNDPEINLIEIVQEAFQVTSFNAETKQIKLLLQIDISQPFILKRVITDRRRILQILLNFLSNSIKFTAQGGYIMVKFKVLEEQVQHESIKSYPQKSLVTNSEENIIKAEKIIEKQLYQQKNQMPMFDKTETLSQKSLDVNSQFLINSYKDITKFIKLKITIEDNGAGIQQENIDKLFTDFQKLNEHKKMNLKGTGLGLSICKQIIELMGGKVTINSEVGVGTKFNIILQLKVIDRIFLNNGNFLMTQNQKIQHLQSLGAFRFTENFNKLFRQNENTAQTIDIYSDDNDNQNQITQIKEDELRMDKQIEKYNFVQLNQQQNQDDNEVSIKNIINQVKDLYNKEKQLMSEFQSNQECKSQSVSIFYNSLISLKDGQYGLSIRDNSQHISIENQKECNENRDNLCNPKNILIRKSSNGLQEEKKYQEQNEHIKKNSDHKEMFSFSHIQLSQMSKQAIYFANKNSNSQKNSNTLSSNGKYKLSSQNSQIEELNPQILHVNQQFLKQEEIKKVNIKDEILEKNESSSIKIILSSPRNQLKLNYYKEAKQILQKYKKRKLNILVANDDSYSLFVIQTTMQQLKSVGQVDIASNGQIALDLVKQNEKINSENKNCHYYDAIFLDLEMPILNGHEACKLIQNYYQMINSASGFDILIPQNLKKSMNNIGLIQEDIEKIENRNSNFQDLWIVDLKYLYDMYQDLITMKQDNIEKQQSNESQINEEQIEPKILKIFNAHYSSQRYQVLKYMNRPFMFAYSAMINGKIQEKVKQSGFEECIDAPLNKIKIETMISEYLNLYAFNLTNQLLTKQGPVPNFVDMIDDMRIKKIWMESSSEMERSIGSLQSRDLKSININELSNNNSQDQKILDQQNDGSFKMFEMNYEKENGFQIQKQNGKEYHSVNVQQYDELSNIMEVQEKEEINSQYSIFLSNGEVKHNQEIQNVEFEIEDEIEEQFSLQENINYPMGSSSLNRFVDKSLNP